MAWDAAEVVRQAVKSRVVRFYRSVEPCEGDCIVIVTDDEGKLSPNAVFLIGHCCEEWEQRYIVDVDGEGTLTSARLLLCGRLSGTETPLSQIFAELVPISGDILSWEGRLFQVGDPVEINLDTVNWITAAQRVLLAGIDPEALIIR